MKLEFSPLSAKLHKYNFSRKFFCWSRVVLFVRTDRQTGMIKLTGAFRNSRKASKTSAIVITAIIGSSKITIKSSAATHNVRVTAVITFKITFLPMRNSDTVEENDTVQADSDGMLGLSCGRTTC
jgi:hypothetical protein